MATGRLNSNQNDGKAMFFTPHCLCLSRYWVAIGADSGDIQLHSTLIELEITFCIVFRER